jgi:hypothetical protein
MIGWQRTLYQLIVGVPVEHLNSLDLNLPWDLLYLFLVLKATLVLKSSLAILL